MPDELTPDLANVSADWSRKSDAFSLTVLCGAIRIVIFLAWWVTACTRSFIERRSHPSDEPQNSARFLNSTRGSFRNGSTALQARASKPQGPSRHVQFSDRAGQSFSGPQLGRERQERPLVAHYLLAS